MRNFVNKIKPKTVRLDANVSVVGVGDFVKANPCVSVNERPAAPPPTPPSKGGIPPDPIFLAASSAARKVKEPAIENGSSNFPRDGSSATQTSDEPGNYQGVRITANKQRDTREVQVDLNLSAKAYYGENHDVGVGIQLTKPILRNLNPVFKNQPSTLMAVVDLQNIHLSSTPPCEGVARTQVSASPVTGVKKDGGYVSYDMVARTGNLSELTDFRGSISLRGGVSKTLGKAEFKESQIAVGTQTGAVAAVPVPNEPPPVEPSWVRYFSASTVGVALFLTLGLLIKGVPLSGTRVGPNVTNVPERMAFPRSTLPTRARIRTRPGILRKRRHDDERRPPKAVYGRPLDLTDTLNLPVIYLHILRLPNGLCVLYLGRGGGSDVASRGISRIADEIKEFGWNPLDFRSLWDIALGIIRAPRRIKFTNWKFKLAVLLRAQFFRPADVPLYREVYHCKGQLHTSSTPTVEMGDAELSALLEVLEQGTFYGEPIPLVTGRRFIFANRRPYSGQIRPVTPYREVLFDLYMSAINATADQINNLSQQELESFHLKTTPQGWRPQGW